MNGITGKVTHHYWWENGKYYRYQINHYHSGMEVWADKMWKKVVEPDNVDTDEDVMSPEEAAKVLESFSNHNKPTIPAKRLPSKGVANA